MHDILLHVFDKSDIAFIGIREKSDKFDFDPGEQPSRH